MMNLPAPLLRSFDLLVFAHEYGTLNLKDCEAVRSVLRQQNEGLPRAFRNSSFEDGMKSFPCRLQIDPSVSVATPAATYDDPLVLVPL
jgi:hypothetical protein